MIKKKKRRRSSRNFKGPYSQSYIFFPSNQVWMWDLDHKEDWVPKNWHFQIVVLKDSWESLVLQGDEFRKWIQMNKGNQPWIFTGRNEAETSILWPLDVKNKLIGKEPSAGKDWEQEQKGMTEDEVVGWHHQLNEHECEQALGGSERQGSLICYQGVTVRHDLTIEQQPNSFPLKIKIRSF